MTKFITYYNLFPIPDLKEFLGTVADCDDGHVITTLSKNIVIVLNIRTQKQVRSWSVVEKLSTKVVYDSASEKYVGVFGNNTLRCWDASTRDVNKCRKLKFPRNIAELLNDSTGRAILLYWNGTVEPLTIALQTRKELPLSNFDAEDMALTYTICDPSIIKINETEQLLCYFKRYNRSNELSLVCQTLTMEGVLTDAAAVEYKLSIGETDLKCMGYAIVETTTVPMLMTIWSDKRIFMMNLISKSAGEDTPGNFVSMLNDLDVTNALSIHCISRNFVAIYGAKSGQDGGLLLLYNTQFKLVKAKQYFKIYFALSRLWSLDEHILLAMGQNLSVVTYRMSKELLSELIGTNRANTFDTVLDEDYINEEEVYEESLTYAGELKPPKLQKPKDNKNNAQKKDRPHIITADGKTVPFMPVAAVDQEINALSQKLLHVTFQAGTTDDADEDIAQLEILNNLNDPGCTQLQLQHLIQQMECCGASEHELSEKLLTVFMRLQRNEDILMCLRRYMNISEKMIAKTLRYALDLCASANVAIEESEEPMDADADVDADVDSDEKSEADVDTDADVDVDVECVTPNLKRPSGKRELPNKNILANAKLTTTATSREQPLPLQLLNTVLSLQYDANSMSVHIRREITYAQVLQLLRHLHALLTSPTISRFSARPSFAPTCVEFELQLFRWFGIILNSHFQQLIMAKDLELIDLLYKWSELFLLYKREASELEATCTMLYDIVEQRKNTMQQNYAKWYSIEEVDLF